MNIHKRYEKSAVMAASFVLATVAFVPLSSVALTQNTTITSEIGSVISLLTTGGTVSLDSTPTAAGVQTTASDTVTVSTNASGGYNLQLASSSASTDLSSGSDTIAATSGTQASPTALTANKWGYRVNSVGGFGSGPTTTQSSAAIGALTYAGVPASGAEATIKTTSSPASNDTTQIWYSLAVNTNQPAGTYTNTVTYTAVPN
jgi:hypothetical protein